MRIRGPKSSASDASDHHHSVSSSSSSSITAANSSLASSQASSNSTQFDSPPLYPHYHRWHGLDLLVKAVYQVNAGSVVGVPYIQRRVVIRRRRRVLKFDPPFVSVEKSGASVCNGRVSSVKGKKKKKVMKSKKKQTKAIKKVRSNNVQDLILGAWGGRSEVVGELGM